MYLCLFMYLPVYHPITCRILPCKIRDLDLPATVFLAPRALSGTKEARSSWLIHLISSKLLRPQKSIPTKQSQLYSQDFFLKLDTHTHTPQVRAYRDSKNRTVHTLHSLNDKHHTDLRSRHPQVCALALLPTKPRGQGQSLYFSVRQCPHPWSGAVTGAYRIVTIKSINWAGP